MAVGKLSTEWGIFVPHPWDGSGISRDGSTGFLGLMKLSWDLVALFTMQPHLHDRLRAQAFSFTWKENHAVQGRGSGAGQTSDLSYPQQISSCSFSMQACRAMSHADAEGVKNR